MNNFQNGQRIVLRPDQLSLFSALLDSKKRLSFVLRPRKWGLTTTITEYIKTSIACDEFICYVTDSYGYTVDLKEKFVGNDVSIDRIDFCNVDYTYVLKGKKFNTIIIDNVYKFPDNFLIDIILSCHPDKIVFTQTGSWKNDITSFYLYKQALNGEIDYAEVL